MAALPPRHHTKSTFRAATEAVALKCPSGPGRGRTSGQQFALRYIKAGRLNSGNVAGAMSLSRAIAQAVVLGLALVTGLVATPAAGQADAETDLWIKPDPAGEPQVQLYFLYSETCPHCARAKPFVEDLAERTDWLRLRSLPVSDSAENRVLFQTLARALNQQVQGVPTFAFCGEMYVGYDNDTSMGAFLERRLSDCYTAQVSAQHEDVAEAAPPLPMLPLIGAVDPKKLSLPIFTLVIAGMDAFNPCAFFVLLFLLSLMVHAQSRARMAIVGGVFVTVAGLAYFAFMAAWLNLFLLLGQQRFITAAAGVVAIAAASLNIKEYLLPGQGPSLSISETAKPSLFARMRKLIGTARMPALLAGTIVLSLAANSYELLCTAGFPLLFTRILTLEELPTSSYYLYLAGYNVIYVIPLFAIVAAFTVTLGSRKLTAMEGRALKLLSGLMMLGFGLVLLLAPGLLDSLVTAILLLAAAVFCTFLIIRIDRRQTAGATYRQSRP